MNGMVTHRDSFLRSALARDNRFQPFADTEAWLHGLRAHCECRVERIPFAEMDQWYFAPGSGNLQHRSGRFFSVVGLRCTPANGAPEWDQPIIAQPEVGILGIITREFDGTRYFLMQAKMEPGNAHLVQLSPTVQATFSNYSQAHKGVLPPYISYFLDPKARVINSQLQSETGTRFFRKFNRNVLLDIEEDIEVLPGFRWLTLHEIRRLMRQENMVNMDARSVLSNIGFADLQPPGKASIFLRSLAAAPDAARHSLDELHTWLRALRERLAIGTQLIDLSAVGGWVRDDWSIRHESHNYFEVAGVRVTGAGREVQQWCQPLLKHEGIGLSGFLCAEIGGVLHFLMQAKPEPGIVGGVEIGPTVSLFDYQRRAALGATVPYLDNFLRADAGAIVHSSIQSEEGGRFWGLSNHVLVVRVSAADAVNRIENFAWMTLAQLRQLSQSESVINSEARTLLACLPLSDEASA